MVSEGEQLIYKPSNVIYDLMNPNTTNLKNKCLSSCGWLSNLSHLKNLKFYIKYDWIHFIIYAVKLNVHNYKQMELHDCVYSRYNSLRNQKMWTIKYYALTRVSIDILVILLLCNLKRHNLTYVDSDSDV